MTAIYIGNFGTHVCVDTRFIVTSNNKYMNACVRFFDLKYYIWSINIKDLNHK